MSDVVRMFVGCAANHEDAESQAVLEWSVRKRASLPVDITWMRLSFDTASPFYGWDTSEWATPFSGFRWAVPELCGFEGHAIYCDSDFVFLADVVELWAQKPESFYVVTGKGGDDWRLCCCLWDCAAARGHLPRIVDIKTDSASHARLNRTFRGSGLVQPFCGDWNNLDGRRGEPLSSIKALHYTDMRTQPHLARATARLAAVGRRHWYDGPTRPHPRADVRELFERTLKEAVKNGYTVDRYTPHEPFGPYVKRSFAGRC